VHWHGCFWRHGWHWHNRCRARWWVGTYPVYAAPVYTASVVRPVAASCTCLRKEYLPNGSVLFRDVCTNESAINPPAQNAEVAQ
jgi:hypothetical protein